MTGFAVTLNQNLHTAVQAISPRTLHIMDRLRYKFSAAYRHCHFWQAVARCGRQLRHLKTLETRLKTDLQLLAESIELLPNDQLYAPTDAWIRWLGATFLVYLLRICRLHGQCAIAARKCYEQLTLEQLVVLNLVLISTVARMASELQTAIMTLIRFYDMSLSRWLRAIEPDFPVTAGGIREVIDVIKPAQSHGEVTSTVATTSHLDFITRLLQQCDRATDKSTNKAASNWLMINRTVFSAFAQNQSKTTQNTVEQLSGAGDFTFDYGEAIERRCRSDPLDIEGNKPLGFEIDRFGTMPENGPMVISQVKTFRCVKKLLLQLHKQTDPVMVQQRETIGKIIRTVRKDATIVGKKAKRTVIMGKVREMLTEYNDFT